MNEVDKNFYIINRQKLLFMVKELHKRGFGKLRIIPSISPSGLHWRCKFIDDMKNSSFIASNWLCNYEDLQEEIRQTSEEMADLFIKDNFEFVEHCKGENDEYVKWYNGMVESLEEDELPYAFSDYFSSTDFWKTSKDNEIKTLPNEYKYYH